MNDSTRKVELHPAHIWTCEDCGRDNFERCVEAEMPDDERAEMFRKFHHMQEYEELPEGWEGFGMVTAPEEVTCQHCGAEFETEEHGTIEDED